MGTAYLFTHEAVECGAIEPSFQRAAVACEDTVLLETSPGHSTRCAVTAYASAFEREKQRLANAGVATKDAWVQLEQLNLGRLRIAAKGLRRDGDVIESVDAETQEREGMYMIGQVAALRGETLSIAELHEDVSVHGTELLGTRDSMREIARPTDIAIVGLAAIFPGAPDTDAFWANIVAGKSAIREVPAERWDVATYYDPAATGLDAGKKTPCKWGGFLDDVPFDPLAYGIPPKSLAAIEPVQLLALEIAKRALADAGYSATASDGGRAFDRASTSVIFGAEAGTDLSSAYSFRALFPHYVGPLPEALEGSLPTLSEDSFPGVLSNVIAGRIANRLDLGGVNFTVDAACAASLAAVDMAVKELASGSSDMVLCGGADLHNSINDYLMFSSVHALSPTGQCHTFDAAADGIVLGEGVACVVLKRLGDAERDGDRIYAVIKGVAGASDGKSLGLTAPRKEGQVRALERAYAAAGLSPAEVGLVEAHGTGTIVGDRTELATLTDVFTAAGANPAGCALGSVKSQIGHTKCAAGMAGLIKAALSIHHGVLPPTLNIKSPSLAWQRDTSPFVFLDRARPWLAAQRVAAVSAFGFGGTNFHAVLAQHAGETQANHAWPSELVVVRDVAAVERALAAAPRLRDLARTCARADGPVIAAIVADHLDDLRDKLAQVRRGEASRDVWLAGGVTGAVAFLCPGQGSQRPGMLAELFVAFPRLHRLLELGAPWAATMLPPAAFGADDRAAQAAALTDTRVAQPALGMADLAVAELLATCNVHPDMIAGHSYGELAALGIAGAIGEADLLMLSEARGEAILEAAAGEPGTMAAVAADGETVARLIEDTGAVIANYNSPKQTVISGSNEAVAASLERCATAKIAAKKFAVACAFHSPIVAGAHRALAERLDEIAIAEPAVPVYSNTTAAPYPSSPDAVRSLLAAQVAQPVRFAEQLEAMYDAGARLFVEVGPGQVLTRLAGDVLGDRPHVAIACDGGDTSLKPFLRALAALAVSGVAVEVEALFQHRDAGLVDLAAPPVKAKPWLVNGQRTRAANGEPPMPQRPIGFPTAAPVAAAAAPAANDRDGVVIEYLRTMRSMITAQRDVMLSYLGSVPAPMLETAHPVIDVPARASLPAMAAAPAPVPIAAAPAPAIKLDPMQLVISIVSERTGYPAETLGIDLDLEADLSIDSIKRIEIIGELAQRLGLRIDGHNGADALVEELATKKTLRGLVAWLVERLDTSAPTPAEPGEVERLVTEPASLAAGPGSAPGSAIEVAAAPVVSAVQRYRLGVIAAPAPVNGHTSFSGKRFAIHDGGPIGDALGARLAAEGAIVHPRRARRPGRWLRRPGDRRRRRHDARDVRARPRRGARRREADLRRDHERRARARRPRWPGRPDQDRRGRVARGARPGRRSRFHRRRRGDAASRAARRRSSRRDRLRRGRALQPGGDPGRDSDRRGRARSGFGRARDRRRARDHREGRDRARAAPRLPDRAGRPLGAAGCRGPHARGCPRCPGPARRARQARRHAGDHRGAGRARAGRPRDPRDARGTRRSRRLSRRRRAHARARDADRRALRTARPHRRGDPRRRDPRGQADPPQDAGVVRAGVLDQAHRRADPRRQAARRRQARRAVLEHLGSVRQPWPGRLRRRRRRARQARVDAAAQDHRPRGLDRLGAVGRYGHGLGRARARVREA